jgi:actin-related protein 6
LIISFIPSSFIHFFCFHFFPFIVFHSAAAAAIAIAVAVAMDGAGSAPPIVLLDNGAGHIKCGRLGVPGADQGQGQGQGQSAQIQPSFVVSNCVANVQKQMQVLVGDQVDSALNGSLLYYQRPHERGYVTKWSTEIDVWSRLFGREFLNIDPAESGLALTEPPVNPVALQNDTNEVVFEEFGFDRYSRRLGVWYSGYEFARNPPAGASSLPNCCTVVDSGFSFSQIMPILDGYCKLNGSKRVNVGGKFLTNYLKEVVSYRQWNMMDEFKLINEVPHAVVYKIS